jgi:hypothetical protein
MERYPWNGAESDDYDCYLENELKRQTLQAHFQIQLAPKEPEPEPETDADFDAEFDRMESVFACEERLPVRQILGNPRLASLANLAGETLSLELDLLYDLLAWHNIALDVICEEPDEEIYRFIVEEFMDELHPILSMPGLFSHYTYEDYHPNPELDIQYALNDLLMGWFLWGDVGADDGDDLSIPILEPRERTPEEEFQYKFVFLHEERYPRERMMERYMLFRQKFERIADFSFEVRSCDVEPGRAEATAYVQWTGIPAAGGEPVQVQGLAQFILTPSPYDGWEVVHFRIPGLDG